MRSPTKTLIFIPLFLAITTPAFAISQNPFLLPNNPLYLFKYTFDQIRISLTVNPVNKATLYQQLAKDKLNEAYSLAAISQNDLAKQAIFEYQQYSKQSTELASSGQKPTDKSDKILSQIAEGSTQDNITLSRTESLLPEDLRVYIAEAIESNNKNQTLAIQGLSANELQALEQKIKAQKEALNQQILAAEKEIRAKQTISKTAAKSKPLPTTISQKTEQAASFSITELNEQKQYLEELEKTIEETTTNEEAIIPTPSPISNSKTEITNAAQQTNQKPNKEDDEDEEKKPKKMIIKNISNETEKTSDTINQSEKKPENEEDDDHTRKGSSSWGNKTNTILVQGASTTKEESLIAKILKFLKIK